MALCGALRCISSCTRTDALLYYGANPRGVSTKMVHKASRMQIFAPLMVLKISSARILSGKL